MWNIEDKNGFESESLMKRGQINPEQDFGKIIFELSSNQENKIFVDIGTWNGLGSTMCFINGMKKNKDSILYTIENNKEKIDFAKSYWKETINTESLNVIFLNGSLISNIDIDEYIINNGIVLNEQQEYWLNIDKNNSSNILNIDLDKIDILLIDGSDYSGYLELMKLKDISKYILLDDTNSMKNDRSRRYLIESDLFDLVKEDINSRNGYSVFKRR